MVEIKHRDTGAVIRAVNVASLAEADLAGADLAWADLHRANLRGANFAETNLSWADLQWTNLLGANLLGADLSGANLHGADLREADLCQANLCKADLFEADLRNANLTEANLRGANLARAILFRADFRGSNLAEADLAEIRADVFAVLSLARNEVAGLRLAVVKGRINGMAYEGECACLVGTIAILQTCEYRQVPGISIDETRPAERFFTGIRKGDTPETNPVATIVLGWIDEFIATPAMRRRERGRDQVS